MPKNQVEIPLRILEAGWEYHSKCRCNGSLTYNFRHPEKPKHELNWFVHYGQFKIMEGRKTRARATKLDQLEATLQNL